MASALQSLPPVSIVIFILGREMRVEVAVHSVLRNHGVAERTLVRTAALRCRHLCPHVDHIIAPLRAPEKLQSQPEKEIYIIYRPNGSYARSIKACFNRMDHLAFKYQPHYRDLQETSSNRPKFLQKTLCAVTTGQFMEI